MSFIKIRTWLVAHYLLDFKRSLYCFLLHSAYTWNDKVKCDLVFWAGFMSLL
jgi:hypothetical protein